MFHAGFSLAARRSDARATETETTLLDFRLTVTRATDPSIDRKSHLARVTYYSGKPNFLFPRFLLGPYNLFRPTYILRRRIFYETD